MENIMNENVKKRLELLDTVRGITVISMILYHALWDICYLGLAPQSLISSNAAAVWQLTICCSFILLSGYCFPMGSRKIRHGIVIMGWGVAITVVTCTFVPQTSDIFGVLWLLGICALIACLLHHCFEELTPPLSAVWAIVCLIGFSGFYRVGTGYLDLVHPVKLPRGLYHGLFMSLIGFRDPEFFSVDYFPLLPWAFLYFTGYFLNRMTAGNEKLKKALTPGLPFFSFIGRHSLVIYLVHQPVVYGLTNLIAYMVK